MSFNQQNSSNYRDSAHGENRSTQTIVKENDKNFPKNRKRPSSSATDSQVGSKSEDSRKLILIAGDSIEL